MMIPEKLQPFVNEVVERLVAKLGTNLYSCILYGSAVRGDMVPDVSDVNLLLVLKESTPAAHASIAEAVQGPIAVAPFILGRQGLERSIRAFATKFLSIRRNYRVLHGADFLADVTIEPELDRFLVEQALRNQRLRLVHAYVTLRGTPQRYTSYLLHLRIGVLVQVSTALRLNGVEMPHDHADRIPIIEQQIGQDASVLRDLATVKERRRPLSAQEIDQYHARMFHLLDSAVKWLEQQWPSP